MDREVEINKIVEINEGSLPTEFIVLAMQIVNNKYKVKEYKEYAELISKEFNCICTVNDIYDASSYSLAYTDYVLARKNLGFWD